MSNPSGPGGAGGGSIGTNPTPNNAPNGISPNGSGVQTGPSNTH
jgi:hypothetical protein